MTFPLFHCSAYRATILFLLSPIKFHFLLTSCTAHSLTRILTFISLIYPTHHSDTMVSGRVRRSRDTYAGSIVDYQTKTAIDSVPWPPGMAPGPRKGRGSLGIRSMRNARVRLSQSSEPFHAKNHAGTRLLLIMLLTPFMTTSWQNPIRLPRLVKRERLNVDWLGNQLNTNGRRRTGPRDIQRRRERDVA